MKRLNTFKKSFILANVCSDIFFKKSFFILSNANIKFFKAIVTLIRIHHDQSSAHNLLDRSYRFEKICHCRYKQKQRGFCYTYNYFFSLQNHHKIKLILFLVDEALITIPPKYFEFTDVFSSEFIVKLLKYTSINNNAINLINYQQTLYKPIYRLGLM